jgi:hypothetical protein
MKNGECYCLGLSYATLWYGKGEAQVTFHVEGLTSSLTLIIIAIYLYEMM